MRIAAAQSLGALGPAARSAMPNIDGMLRQAVTIKDFPVVVQKIEGADMELLRKTADLLKQKSPRLVACLGSAIEERVHLVIASNISQFDASALIKQIAGEISGSGGGRKDFAQAGGTHPENLSRAFQKLKEILSR